MAVSYVANNNTDQLNTVQLTMAENSTAPGGQDSEGGTPSLFMDNPESYIVPVIFAFIFIIGIIGNGTLIYIVFKNKTMQNTPNILIVSLALGDLLLILVSVPFTATIYTLTYWPYGEPMCKINEFLQVVSLGVSVFTLTALSGDRFVAIVYPMRRHRGAPMLRTLVAAVSIWILSVGLALLEVFGAHLTVHGDIAICYHLPSDWPTWYPKFHTMYRFVIYFAIPILIITGFYVSMAWILWQSGRKMPGEAQRIMGGGKGPAAKQLEGRKKVAKLVLSFIIVFMICWLPRHIFTLWYFYDPGNYNLFWHVFKFFGFCLCFTNSCVNPVALYFLSQQFRKYYDKYLFCCCKTRRTRREGSDYSETSNLHQIKANRNGISETGVTAESVL